LDGHSAAGDAILRLSELATNAAIHRRGSHVWVEVTDQGGRWQPEVPSTDLNGRGLLVVTRLAHNWGRTGDEETGWTVWFEIEGQ
jgi:hypothetical protein